MASADVCAREIGRLAACWATLRAGPEYAAVAAGFTDDELHQAVTRILRDYDAPAPPKPALLLRTLGAVAAARRQAHARAHEDTDTPDYCPLCHTRYLAERSDTPQDITEWCAEQRKPWTPWISTDDDGRAWLQLPPRLHPAHYTSCPLHTPT